MAKKIMCPKCKSLNWEVLGEGKKKVSITKGIVGGALLGPIGAAAGGVGIGKKGTYNLVCRDCGSRWTEKKM